MRRFKRTTTVAAVGTAALLAVSGCTQSIIALAFSYIVHLASSCQKG